MLLITLFLFAAACSSVFFRYVKSYDKIKQAFSGDNIPVFPDLALFQCEEPSFTYRLNYGNAYHRPDDLHGYTVYGDGTYNGSNVNCTLTARDRLIEFAEIEDPIIYGETKIAHASSTYENSLFETYGAFVNGFEYRVSVFFNEGLSLSETDASALRASLSDMLYAFICSIIDEATEA